MFVICSYALATIFRQCGHKICAISVLLFHPNCTSESCIYLEDTFCVKILLCAMFNFSCNTEHLQSCYILMPHQRLEQTPTSFTSIARGKCTHFNLLVFNAATELCFTKVRLQFAE